MSGVTSANHARQWSILGFFNAAGLKALRVQKHPTETRYPVFSKMNPKGPLAESVYKTGLTSVGAQAR